jgi:hypothetical protein
MHSSDFAPYFEAWTDAWHFADPETTAERLRRVGFQHIAASLQPAPVSFENVRRFQTFVNHVCLRGHLARLPAHLRDPFSDELVRQAARDTPAFTLDYCRLNLSAIRPS